MSVIDDLLSKVDAPQKAKLERIRMIIHKVVPDAQEVMTYGMPGFKYMNKYLISFAAFKDHMSIFPGSKAVEVLKSEFTDYKTSKGTIQFTLEQPIPEALLKKILKLRVADITQK